MAPWLILDTRAVPARNAYFELFLIFLPSKTCISFREKGEGFISELPKIY